MTVTEQSRLPVRPHSVPETAEWHPDSREWLFGTRDAAGRWQGEVVGYRADGTRASLRNFREGQLDGAALRYHPNGEVARSARYVLGKPEGELRATASSEPTPERLRGCCVPQNAWSLVTCYESGQLQDEWFEDETGRRLLSDGSLRPDRPESVPAHAAFDEGSRRWYEGRSEPKRGRKGLWRWWLESGELVEQCEFDAGRPSGAALLKHIAPGTFADSRISSWSGHFDAGQRAGAWRFLDAAGALLHEREFGAPCVLLGTDHPVLARDCPDLAGLSQQMLRSGQLGLGLSALARACARSGSFDELRRALEARTLPLSPLASQRRATEIKRGKQHSLAVWVQALVDGVEPSVAFSNLAMLLLGHPEVGLEFAQAAVELDPQYHRFRLTRALLQFEVGNPRAALAEAELLQAGQARAAELIRDYHRILFTCPGFLPASYAAEAPANPELPGQVSQPLTSVVGLVGKYALRHTRLRRRLVDLHGDDPDWLPPDLSHLYDEANVQLETYSFEEPDGEDGVEVIQVDESLTLQGLGTTALLRRARVEWVGLCWLCWGAGLDRVARPEAVAKREGFAEVLASSLFRVYRMTDSVQTLGLRSKRQGLPSTHWEGSDVDALDPLFAGMAKDEAYEMRAVLFFLADARCRSTWQDDLRES